MVKLVDTQALEACGEGRVGSSPTTRTNIIGKLNSKELENIRALLSSILQYGQFSNKDQLLKKIINR